jgi:hypothetical protein
MRCPPQPASARAIDKKHADVIKALKMFTALPLLQTDETLARFPREVSNMDDQAAVLTSQTFILMLETS